MRSRIGMFALFAISVLGIVFYGLYEKKSINRSLKSDTTLDCSSCATTLNFEPYINSQFSQIAFFILVGTLTAYFVFSIFVAVYNQRWVISFKGISTGVSENADDLNVSKKQMATLRKSIEVNNDGDT